MSKVKFSSKQQEILRNNKYTVRVTANILSLSKEFKEIFYKEYLSGEIPSNILCKYGYPVEILGKERIWGISYCIRKEYEKNCSFSDIRSGTSGTASPSQSTENSLRQLQTKVDYLTQEVEFLKKFHQSEIQRNRRYYHA